MWILPTYLITYLHYTIPILPTYMAHSPFQVAFVMAHAHSKLIGSHVDDIRLFNIYDPRENLGTWISVSKNPDPTLLSMGSRLEHGP